MSDWSTDTNYNSPGDPWDGTPTKVAPSAGKRQQGFEPTESPSAQELNYLLNEIQGGLQSTTIYTSGSGTYNLPSGIRAIRVHLVGGGGGGGGAQGNSTGSGAAGGGGGGGYVSALITSPASSYSYSVGGGGIGGSGASAGNGTSGGNTTFSTYTAGGGVGGTGVIDSATYVSAAGGGGGTATGGDVNLTGQDGAIGVGASSAALGLVLRVGSGGDAAGLYGGPGAPGLTPTSLTSTSAGANGEVYGGGGSGGCVGDSTADATGGNGADGYILIEEFGD